jgi:hypothetical protein
MPTMPQRFTPPAECPVCGADVPRGAKACPDCGADERSGWDDDATRYDGLDLPDEALADDPPPAPVRRPPRDRTWIALTILVLFALIMTFYFH